MAEGGIAVSVGSMVEEMIEGLFDGAVEGVIEGLFEQDSREIADMPSRTARVRPLFRKLVHLSDFSLAMLCIVPHSMSMMGTSSTGPMVVAA
jgi:hypothetical protein